MKLVQRPLLNDGGTLIYSVWIKDPLTWLGYSNSAAPDLFITLDSINIALDKQRQGYGTELLNQLVEEARMFNSNHIVAWVDIEEYPQSLAWFLKQKFIPSTLDIGGLMQPVIAFITGTPVKGYDVAELLKGATADGLSKV